MGLVVLVVPLQVGNSAAMVRTGRTVLMVPVQDLDLMTGGMVLAVLIALGQMAREGQRMARQLRKEGNLDHIANQISRTRREISTTRRDSAGRHGFFSCDCQKTDQKNKLIKVSWKVLRGQNRPRKD
jgi:hypothetical protein